MEPLHSHKFVEEFAEMVGFGLDRETDEATVQVFLQKFSDDECMKAILPRMSDEDLASVFDLISVLLRRHFDEKEYHALFLKEAHSQGEES